MNNDELCSAVMGSAPRLVVAWQLAGLSSTQGTASQSADHVDRALAHSALLRSNVVAHSVSFIYRYILRDSCSQFDSLPLTSLAPKDGLRFAITLPGYGAEREFRFVDNPLMQLRRSGDRLGEWAKIVAVVANGNEWQFKGWPKGFRTPADIFTKSQVRRVRGVVLFSSGRS